jgi:hypothetical protein
MASSRLPRSIAKKRTVYGGGAPTAKQVAKFLRGRCHKSTSSGALSHEGEEYIRVSDLFQPDAPGVWSFRMTRRTLTRVLWHCRINVSPELSVYIDEEQMGKIPSEILECALDGI